MNLDNKVKKWCDNLGKTHDYFVNAINNSTILRCCVIKNHYQELTDIQPIVNFIDNRIDTILLLTENLRLWDAEMQFRSALEVTAKLSRIVLASDRDTRDKRISEFWDDMYEINILKRAKKARSYMNLPIDIELKAQFNALMLSDDEFNRLCEKWPRRCQKTLEESWSFNSILKELSTQNVLPERISKILETISYNYKMSSHLIHGDETGIMIIEEREKDSWEERSDINAKHLKRLLSDCFFLSATISLFTAIFANDKEIEDKVNSLITKTLLNMSNLH